MTKVKKQSELVTITFTLDSELKSVIQETAQKQMRSVSSLLRLALSEYLEKHYEKKS